MHEFDTQGSAWKSGTNAEWNKVTYGGKVPNCLKVQTSEVCDWSL